MEAMKVVGTPDGYKEALKFARGTDNITATDVNMASANNGILIWDGWSNISQLIRPGSYLVKMTEPRGGRVSITGMCEEAFNELFIEE